MSKKSCVIVGGGHAAAQLALSLRDNGWKDDITIVTEEEHSPYHRPPLSKEFLYGDKAVADILINKNDIYQEHDIRVLTNTKVTSINRKDHTVKVSGQVDSLHYDKLAITTGARVRKLGAPGSELEGVCYIRTANDAQAIKAYAKHAKNAVIVGGGYIGLESAASLAKLGVKVTIIEAFDRLLSRVASPEVSYFFERVHQEESVKIVKNVTVERIDGEGHVEAVVTNDGQSHPADLVIIGIGVIPTTDLASSCGLKVDMGILVDENSCTNDPDIVAAGDCTEFRSSLYQRNIRLESVHNALAQADSAAAYIVGNNKPYHEVPWFWSNQYDIKLQIAGLLTGYDEVVVRGDLSQGRKGTLLYLKDKKIISVYAINSPPDFAIGKRLIESQVTLDTQQLADESVPLRTFIR